MKPEVATLALALLLSGDARAQEAPSRPPTFDVVSIRPNRAGDLQGFPNVSQGRVEFRSTTLKRLIEMAYSRFAFDPRQVVGGPTWIDSNRFDIIATTERPLRLDSAGLPSELFAMIRALIEDRFRVKVHNERREDDVYVLGLARKDGKTGSSLRSVPDVCEEAMKQLTGGKPQPRTGPPRCSFGGPPGRLIGTGVTMTMFGNVLSGSVGRTVIDRTGLTGSFDIELTFDPTSAAKAPPGAPPGPVPRDDTAPSIFTALQEQLGLKLESARGPVDVLVIDSAEPPTPN